MLLNLIKLKDQKSFYIAAFILGLFLSLAFDPYNIPFLSLIIVGAFFKVNDIFYSKYGRLFSGFFIIGIAFGFGFFLSSTYWISNSLLVYGGSIKYFLPFSIIILPLILGLFYGLMQLTICLLWDDSNSKIFYFPVIWILFELIRSHIFSGLPWNLICYSWSWSSNFTQFLSVVGPYGLGIISVFCSCAIFSFKIKKENFFLTALSIIIILLIFLYGFKRINNYEEVLSKDFKVRIVGTHIEQLNKWSIETRNIVEKLKSENYLTIIPETMAGLKPFEGSDWFQGYLRVDDNKYYNSIAYNGSVYDKKHLVPFGEYIPFSEFIMGLPFAKYFNLNSLSKGKNNNFPSLFIPLICYEGIFPNIVAQNRRENAKLIINITNDSWFGKKTGPMQHFTHIRFRAIEEGLPLARSSNMGFSALINPLGVITHQVSYGANGFVDVTVPIGVDTIYAKYRYKIVYFLMVLLIIFGYFTKILFKKREIFNE